jgi:hypothetical protein
MIPVPDNAALFKHVDMVCHNHGGEAVADNNGRPPVNERFELFFVYPVSDRRSPVNCS